MSQLTLKISHEDLILLEQVRSVGIFDFYAQYKWHIFLMSFFLGRILGVLWNLRYDFAKQYAIFQAVENRDFEQLLLRGLEFDIPILFTLKTDKVYLGWAVSMPNPTLERRWVRILPMASGYRDPHTQDVAFVTYYLDVLEGLQTIEDLSHLETEDFEVVMPIEQIVSAHLFDVAAYNQLNEDTD